MWRPTVRYDERYRDYIDTLFKTSRLDRNQIMRLALFSAPYSPLFQAQIKQFRASEDEASHEWEIWEHELWKQQSVEKKKEAQQRANNAIIIKDKGGIVLRL